MRFVFSNYVKIVKKCFNDPNMANESVIYYLYEVFDKVYNNVTAEDASHLMNRETNIKKSIGTAISIDKRSEWMGNFELFYSKYIDVNKTSSVVSELINIIEKDKTILEDIKIELLKDSANKKVFIFSSLLESLKVKNKILDKKINIESWGKNRINLYYGDLFKLAFDKRYENNKKCIIIPMDTEFNLNVDDNNKYAVASDSIHGQWILKMIDRGVKKAEIRRRINAQMKKMPKEAEKRKGEIIQYKYGNTTFLLFAFTSFVDGNATTNIDELKQNLIKIIDYYNYECQGVDLYIPLIGTGRSGLALSYKESFIIIRNVLIENKVRLRGKANILAYYKNADELEEVLEDELLFR